MVGRTDEVKEVEVQDAVGKTRPLYSTTIWPIELMATTAHAEGAFLAFLMRTWATVSLSGLVPFMAAILPATE